MPNKFRNEFRAYDSILTKRKNELSGLLGVYINGQKLIEVPNRPGFVYVRLRNNLNEVIQAFNDTVSIQYDLPVIVAREGNKYRVKGRDVDRYSDWGTSTPYLPVHGNAHSFNPDGGGGGDIVFIYPKQFIPLLLSPSGTDGGPNLLVSDNYAYHKPDGTWITFGITGTPVLTPTYNPTADAHLVLLLADTDTGNIDFLVASGSSFSATITGTYEILQYLPTYTDNTLLPLMAVRLVTGSSAILWENLYDVRQFYTPFASGTAGGGGGFDGYGVVVQDDGGYVVSGTVINFVGDGVSASASGTFARVFITGSSGGTTPPKLDTMWHDQSLVVSGSALVVTHDAAQNYGYYALQNPGADGDIFTNGFYARAGTYTLKFLGYTWSIMGQIDIYIDGNLVSSGLDWYSAASTYNVVKSVSSVSVATDGYHTLKCIVNGKNASSSAYYIELTKIWLVPATY